MEAESINEEAPVVRLKEKSIDAAVIGMVPARFAAHYKVIPVELVDGILTVAMADPLDVRTLDDLRLLLGVEARGVRVDEREIFEAIRHYYGVGAATLDALISRDAPDNQVSSDQERT
ncbi:MAG: hypothetical protein MJA29_11405, partial [Candidatus Omnitrophica bacterium]|nr:hypothetical protein [Candidatus Omnitrophota bacterium]